MSYAQTRDQDTLVFSNPINFNSIVNGESVTHLEIECPPAIEVQCIDDIPEPDINGVVIINAEEGSEPIIQFVKDVCDNGNCPTMITRTYSATDECGCVVYCSQLIKVLDTINPEISDKADFQLETCNEDWPLFLTTTWTDNCCTGGTINSDAGEGTGESEDGCLQYRKYTFKVIDDCGNPDTETTIVSRIYDVTAPVISGVGEDMTIDCPSQPEFSIPTVSDTCDASPALTYEDSEQLDDCGLGTMTRTWTARDCAGNTRTASQTITIQDVIVPIIEDKEDFQLEGCYEEWPEFLITKWTDNCTQGGEINSYNWVDLENSPDGKIQYREYIFNVSDCNGNSNTETTVVSRLISNGETIEGDDIELCRDYGNFDLYILLPDDYVPGGTWILDSGPGEIDISGDGKIFVSEDITPGNYVFHYILECLVTEVTVEILKDIYCVKDCKGGEISTALTPNNDGVNDTFYAGIDTGGSCTVDVQIFNRWGAKIFEAQDYQNDWRGTVTSNTFGPSGTVTTGTYFYIIINKENGNVVGTITGYIYVATE